MTVYGLYAESGPRHKKTMVHVLDLLGCVVRGATTEDALAAAPEAIRDYLAFLRRHKEPGVPPARERIETELVVHLDDGKWMGEGDPDVGFPWDVEPLSDDEAERYTRRLEWMQHDFAALLSGVSARALSAEPAAGRPLVRILGHVAGAQYNYLRAPIGKPNGLAAVVRAIEEGDDPLGAFAEASALVLDRLEAVTAAERVARSKSGAKFVTARRIFRRSLEHQWEHLCEVRERLEP